MDSITLTHYREIPAIRKFAKWAIYLAYPKLNEITDRSKARREFYKIFAEWLGKITPKHLSNLLVATENNALNLPRHRIEKFIAHIEQTIEKFTEEECKKNSTEIGEFKNWISEIRILPNVKRKTTSKRDQFKKAVSIENELPSYFAPLDHFQNSLWSCYELQEKCISKKIFRFKSMLLNGQCEVSLQIAEKNVGQWLGNAKLIEGGSLIVATLENSNSQAHASYTHLAIMKDQRVESPELCIGHKTFIHKDNGNIVTKTVVLIKEQPNSGSSPVNIPFNTAQKYLQSFFDDRKLNRLSSPHTKTINDIQTFREWIKNNNEKSKIHYSFLGKYSVFYKIQNEDPIFEIDNITFSKTLKQNIQATYTTKKNHSYIWFGKLNEITETGTFTVTFDGPYNSQNHDEKIGNKPIFLIINSPTGDEHNINTLIGIITGNRNKNKGAVARLTVLIKDDQDVSAYDKLLKKLFEQFSSSSRVRPPHETAICNLEELKAFLEQNESKTPNNRLSNS